jgi:hypothetical protein
VTDNDCVCSNDDSWLPAFSVVDLATVCVLCFCRSRLEYVVQGTELMGQVFGKLGGADFNVGKANLCAFSKTVVARESVCSPVLEAVSSAAKQKQAQPVVASKYSTMSDSEAEEALPVVFVVLEVLASLKVTCCAHWGLLARPGTVVGVPMAAD